jgi:hypothetical protein
VELIGVLLLLVVLQSVAHLPAGATGFTSFARITSVAEGPSWWVQNPVPGSRSSTGTRPLLRLEDEGLRPVADPQHPLLGRVVARPEAVGPDAIDRVQARGAVVRLGDRAFVRTPDETYAVWLAAQLAAHSGRSLEERLTEAVRTSLSPDAFDEERERLETACRVLRLGIRVYGALLLGVVPVAMLAFGSEAALFWSWPAVALAHLVVFSLLIACVQRLRIDHARLELLLPALLYPPALLRAYGDLTRRQLSRFHPVLHARALLPAGKLHDFLRREFVRLRHPRGGAPLDPLARAELAALQQLLVGCHPGEADLLAPPDRRSAGAVSYCPVCLDEFLDRAERCGVCDVAVLAFPAPPSGS